MSNTLSLPLRLLAAGTAGVAGFFALKFLNEASGVVPSLIPPRSLPMTFGATKQAFTSLLDQALQTARPDLTVTTRALVIAHGAYESGWGKGSAAKGFNFWNLTAGSTWSGTVITAGDTEFSAGATAPKAISQRFRSYGSPAEAALNYFQFLATSRYADALGKLLSGDATFVQDLGAFRLGDDGKTPVPAWGSGVVKGGFYTLPIERYTAGFNAVLADVQPLLGQSPELLAGFPPGSMH